MVHAIKFLMQNPECTPILAQAYAQIILAYVFTEIPMIDKKSLGSNDLIYNSVEYIAKILEMKSVLKRWHSIWG